MKKLQTYTLLLGLLFSAAGWAADSVTQLQKEQKELQKQIEQTNKLLSETKSSAKATVSKLELLNKNIKTQKRLVQNLTNEITALDTEMQELSQRKQSLQNDLEGLRNDYATLVCETHYAQMSQSPLLFLLSANNFNQLLRRIRYMQEFAAFRKEQARRIEATQTEIDIQNNLLSENRSNKQSALKTKQREQDNLARDERKQQKMLDDLKKKEKDLKAKLNKQQAKVAELNKKIDDLIKKQAEEQKKLTKQQQLIAGDFEKNCGRLPWPVQGGTVTGEFGKHQHPVYKEVTLDNKGLYIQCPQKADITAVFEGEVTSCFVMNNSYAVIIQHGNYRSVYSGLGTLCIKQGDKVKAKQKIGTIYTDPDQDNKTELYFQIYKNREIENPSNWLTK